MLLIVGYIIILAASVGTYSVHGSLAALFVPLEYLAIVGLTLGGLVAGNSPKVTRRTAGPLLRSNARPDTTIGRHRPAPTTQLSGRVNDFLAVSGG